MKNSERIIKLREYRGFTQSGLANKAGLSTRCIQNYENTDRKPKGEYLSKLAKALKVPEYAILSDEGLAKFFSEQKTCGTKKAVFDDINSNKATIAGLACLGAAVPLLGAFVLPLAISQLIAVGGIAAVNSVLNKSKQIDNVLKEIYKEISRIEGLTVFINDKMEIVRDEYEQLAILTQQDDIDVSSYKAFIRLSRLLAVYQEYRALLKQKSKYYSFLASEVETYSGKKTEMVKKLVEEINVIEVKEKEYADIIINAGKETSIID